MMTLVSRKKNKIQFESLNTPAVIDEAFLCFDETAAETESDKMILCFPKSEEIDPCTAVPLAGIIEYYRTEKNIEFQFEGTTEILRKTQILSPSKFKYDTHNQVSVLNVVWKFLTSNDVNYLVTAVVRELEQKTQFESGVLPGIEWCLNEVMDNVLQHSASESDDPVGYVMVQMPPKNQHVIFCVCDFGQGIQNSLQNISPPPENSVDAITRAIQEGVTRDKKIGQGNGLWGLHNILRLNAGQLMIATGDGSWFFDGCNIDTTRSHQYLDENHKGTIIDFHVNIEQKVSIAEALNGHSPINYRLESLENETGQQIEFILKNEASGTGTRQSGMKLRNRIMNTVIESPLQIIIDFQGVSVITSSFADELIGKLVVELGFVGFSQQIQLKNMNEIITPIVNRSVSQRIAENF
jgi:hypothetical protein